MKENSAPAPQPTETIVEMFDSLMSQLEAAAGPVPPPIRARFKSIFFAGFAACHTTMCNAVNACDDEENEADGERVAAVFDAFGKELAAFGVSQLVEIINARAKRAAAAAEAAKKN